MNFWQKPLETIQSLLRRKAPKLRQLRHFPSNSLDREVEIDIYLPPDYKYNGSKVYPLLLLNDGQDLPRMHFDIILERLYFEHKIPHIIVIGIHANAERIREYGTVKQADYKGRGDKAWQYGKFVTEELIPYLQKQFKVSDTPENIAFAGFSLGALSAFDIAWANPQLFGNIGVFSGALWWRSAAVNPYNPDADRIMHDIVLTSHQVPEAQYYWFQCGTKDEDEDRNHNGIIDAIDDTLDLIRALKYRNINEVQIRYLEIEDGEHEPITWGKAMPDFLAWAFSKSQGD